MTDEIVIIFNHKQTHFIEKNINLNKLPYSNKNLMKIIIADDSGISNERLQTQFHRRQDLRFVSRDQTPNVGSYMQQINSLYFGLKYINDSKLDISVIHLLDGDDHYYDNHKKIRLKPSCRFSYELRGEIKITENPSKKYCSQKQRGNDIRWRWHRQWTNVVPTSGITISKHFLESFRGIIEMDSFGEVWLDTRLCALLFFKNNQVNLRINESGHFIRLIHNNNASSTSIVRRCKMLWASRRFFKYCLSKFEEIRNI